MKQNQKTERRKRQIEREMERPNNNQKQIDREKRVI